jgi:phosphogluconate dehydratase
MATAVRCHDMFDGALMLGVCDKIVPGLLIGALHYGHLPTVFVPAGPMGSGLSNSDKAKVREQAPRAWWAATRCWQGRAGRLPRPGTCTFYGTANSNQMLLEAMGLHVPGTAFVNPGTALREELTREACAPCWRHRQARHRFTPIGRWWTNAASSTPWWRCWPRAAPPTT